MKDIELIDFETIGRDYDDQIWVVYPKEGSEFHVTVLIEVTGVKVISQVELDTEVITRIKREALEIWAA